MRGWLVDIEFVDDTAQDLSSASLAVACFPDVLGYGVEAEAIAGIEVDEDAVLIQNLPAHFRSTEGEDF